MGERRVSRGGKPPTGSGGRTTVGLAVETKRLLDELKAELRARSYDELFRRLVEVVAEYRRMKARERVRRVVCTEMRESRGSLSAWAKLLARELEDTNAVALALEYLVPDPKEPGIYVVSMERCAGETVSRRPEAEAAAPEPPRPEPEAVAAPKEVLEVKPELEFTTEDYVKGILVPLLRERVGPRAVWELKEFRELLESLTPLPTAEVLNKLVELGYAELRGNQVVLRL
jgi:hypothetical protein